MKSKRKGKTGERTLVSALIGEGIPALRTWQTAQSPDAAVREGDVDILEINGTGPERVHCQVKRVAKLPVFLKALLPSSCTFGFTREDNGDWLVLMRFSTFVKLMKKESL